MLGGAERRAAIAAVALAVAVLVPIGPTAVAAAQEGGPGAPVLADLSVTGTGVSTYPTFLPTTERFGVRTTVDTVGLTVTATTAAPDDELTVAGLPTASGHPRSFTGLSAGDELTVEVSNAAGSRTYGLVYLPSDFPIINVTTHRAGIAPGGLYLGTFTGPPFNMVVDDNGVPMYVGRRTFPSFDFKPQPTGQYTFLEDSGLDTVTGRTVFDAVILDPAMREVERFRTVPPLTSTDNHEVLLLPNGHRILMAYEPVLHHGVLREDTVVQEVDQNGHEVLRWSSWGDVPLSDNLSGNLTEYAHGNSVFVDIDGNLIVSLRGVSALVKINRQTGDLMWTLGGRSSDFTINDPLGGFCGQHDARRLANGHILLFDNGADCAPDGTDRGVSRAAEYAIDEVNLTADLVWSHTQGIYGFATGSAQRQDNGNTLIDWGTAGVITEVDANGEVVFETAPRTPGGIPAASYRARRAPFPDGIKPRVMFVNPPTGITYLQDQQVRANYFCTDEGGSSLDACDGSLRSGALLDTSTPGRHTITVTASDGAGNVRNATRSYRVVANRADVAVRRGSTGRLVGDNVYSQTGVGQTRITRVPAGGLARYEVVIGNDGVVEDTLVVHGTRHNQRFGVRYFDGPTDVSAAVKAGTYQLLAVQPGSRHTLRVEVRARAGTPAGTHLDVYVSAASVAHPADWDAGRLITRRV